MISPRAQAGISLNDTIGEDSLLQVRNAFPWRSHDRKELRIHCEQSCPLSSLFFYGIFRDSPILHLIQGKQFGGEFGKNIDTHVFTFLRFDILPHLEPA